MPPFNDSSVAFCLFVCQSTFARELMAKAFNIAIKLFELVRVCVYLCAFEKLATFIIHASQKFSYVSVLFNLLFVNFFGIKSMSCQ